MVYSTTQTSTGKGIHKQIRQDVTNIPLSTAPAKHFTVTGTFTLTLNSTGTTCGYSNGSFEAVASGGVAPYQYSENGYPYQSSGYFGKKAAGTYVVTAQDATGATTTATVVLTNTYPPAAVSIQRFAEPSNCGMADGSVVLSPTGGTAPFTFSMDWGGYGNSNIFSNLLPGDYIFEVQDQHGCIGRIDITLASPCPMQLGAYSRSELICYPNTGEIRVSRVEGGTPPYQYSIDGVNYQTSPNITGLSVGKWTLYIKDATGLIETKTFAIAYWCSLSVSLITTDATCGNNNGSITATGDFGNLPYMYSIDGTNFQTSSIFSGLAPGTYTVTIKDATGVTNYSDAIIYSGCPSVAGTVTDAICNQANGSIQATGQGGTAPYSFSLDGANFTSNNSFTGLSKGAYTLTIKDANGLLASSLVNVGSACVTASATPTNGTCGNSNGSILVSGTGGTPPYQYSIDGVNFQTAGTFPGLSAAPYTVTIKDAVGLTNQTTVTLGNSPGPTLQQINPTNATCSNNDGALVIDATGGLPPLQYSLDGAYFQSSPQFNRLANGNYVAVVKDANGCTVSQSVSIPLTNNIIAEAGNGGTICQGDSIKLSASTNGDSFSWQAAPGLSDIYTLTPVVKPACTAEYYFTGKSGSCQATDLVTVTVLPAPTADAGANASTCFGKDVMLHGSGGVSYQWTPATSLSDPKSKNPTVQHPVESVEYSLAVADGNGCWSIAPAKIAVHVTLPPAIFIGNDTAIALGEPLPLHIVDINGSGFTDFQWTPTTTLDNPLSADPTALPGNIGIYTYTVTANTPDQCEAIGQIKITVYERADIYVPNAFSPNRDGHNDVLRAIPVGIKEFKYFVIYNRWGQQVFRSTNPGNGWDGRAPGGSLIDGTFVWAAEGVDYMGRPVLRKGTVILIR